MLPEVKSFVMPLGKYKGQSLDKIGSSPEGLKYLDWLVGQEWLKDPTKHFVTEFLKDENVQRELIQALEAES